MTQHPRACGRAIDLAQSSSRGQRAGESFTEEAFVIAVGAFWLNPPPPFHKHSRQAKMISELTPMDSHQKSSNAITRELLPDKVSWRTFQIFYICSSGSGGREREEFGSTEGVGASEEGRKRGGAQPLGGCCAEGGAGANFFFSGPKCPPRFREKAKGRFCKRAALANVPSFRFFGTAVPFFLPSSRLLVLSFLFLYPRSGFCWE